jgi:hypothetical protein
MTHLVEGRAPRLRRHSETSHSGPQGEVFRLDRSFQAPKEFGAHDTQVDILPNPQGRSRGGSRFAAPRQE